MGEKTIIERANKEVDKLLAKAIAKRTVEIKKSEAKIKKLKKEIDKINAGELVPVECEELSSSSSNDKINDFKFPNINPYKPKDEWNYRKKSPLRYGYQSSEKFSW